MNKNTKKAKIIGERQHFTGAGFEQKKTAEIKGDRRGKKREKCGRKKSYNVVVSAPGTGGKLFRKEWFLKVRGDRSNRLKKQKKKE